MPSIGKSGSSKISSKTVVKNENLGTVESQHKKQVEFFEKKRRDLPKLHKKLSDLKNKLAKLLSDIEKGNPHGNGNRNGNGKGVGRNRQVDELKEKIKKLEFDIKKVENQHDKLDYYMNVGPLLFQYFDQRNSVSNYASPSGGSSTNTSCKRGRKNGISTFLQKSQKRIEEDSVKGETGMIFSTANIGMSFKKKSTPFEMLDEFLCRTDPNWVKKSQPEQNNGNNEHFCQDCLCLKFLLHKESKVVCPQCGLQETIIIESDIPSYKDPPPEMNYFEYKRINHFNELLVQFQAKESTHIPKEVYEMIRVELKKERKTVKELNYNRVKRYLKKYSDRGYNHYYDHTFHIINKMNGDKPLSMTPEMEENLRFLFLQIQKPFDKYCPPGRKNFISYNFVFYKFCEMLGYTEFLEYFPLLKSKEKLYQQEKIWEKICDDIGW
jgi:hypothetical protein